MLSLILLKKVAYTRKRLFAVTGLTCIVPPVSEGGRGTDEDKTRRVAEPHVQVAIFRVDPPRMESAGSFEQRPTEPPSHLR